MKEEVMQNKSYHPRKPKVEDDFFCPDCNYQGAAGDCPFCHVPMESLDINENELEEQKAVTYPDELIKKEEGQDTLEE